MKSLSSSIMESIGSSRFGAEKKKKRSKMLLMLFYLFLCRGYGYFAVNS